MIMDWIPAITTTSLLGLVLWLARNWIKVRLTHSVKHEFDKEIESVRAELNAKAAQLESLRSGALSEFHNRNSALYKKRLEAADIIWSAIVSLAPAKHYSEVLARFKVGSLAKEAEKNEELRNIFKTVMSGFDPKKISTPDAHRARPYASKMLWAYFSAYNAIVMRALIQLEMIKAGISEDFSRTEGIMELVEKALPHQKPAIEEYGVDATYHLLDELEEGILKEIERTHNSVSIDEESIKRASNILQSAESVMLENEKAKYESKA